MEQDIQSEVDSSLLRTERAATHEWLPVISWASPHIASSIQVAGISKESVIAQRVSSTVHSRVVCARPSENTEATRWVQEC
jgi:hypothetical protein